MRGIDGKCGIQRERERTGRVEKWEGKGEGRKGGREVKGKGEGWVQGDVARA